MCQDLEFPPCSSCTRILPSLSCNIAPRLHPGLIRERCPGLGSDGSNQCEYRSGRDGKRAKQFQARSPYFAIKKRPPLYRYLSRLCSVKRFATGAQ